jgi:hypothetical protein
MLAPYLRMSVDGTEGTSKQSWAGAGQNSYINRDTCLPQAALDCNKQMHHKNRKLNVLQEMQ